MFTNTLDIGMDVGKPFGVQTIDSTTMNNMIQLWDRISANNPPWLNVEDNIKTINMAKHISDTRAKLITLDIGIAVSGGNAQAGSSATSGRATWHQENVNDLLEMLQMAVADAARVGGMIIKYNGKSWDFLMQGEFWATELDGKRNVVGAIFPEYLTKGTDKYTRLEYHHYDGDTYVITNKAFRDRSTNKERRMLGSEVPLASVAEWANMSEETRINGIDKPLYGYFRFHGSNVYDPASYLAPSVFANAITELEAIDVAISRKNDEVEDSRHITFVGQTLIQQANNRNIKLPRFVKGLGVGVGDTDVSSIHEHSPTMLTEQRLKDINFNLSMAGVKCGFSEGVFVLDGERGVITATQVESDDRDTIQTIKADRDALRAAIDQAVYGADVLATLMNLAPKGSYELEYSFGDITYSYEEDKAAWRSYVTQGWIPRWLYFVKFEGMSEEEAKALTEEAANSAAKGLFT